MSTNTENIKDVSNFDIARLLMSRLWNTYDLGGISSCRAERAGLLEAMTNVASIRWRDEHISTRVLIQESYRRTPVEWPFMPESLSDLRSLCFGHFCSFCLDKMGEWYSQDPLVEVSQGCFVSIAERDIFDAVSRILRAKEEAALLKAHGFTPTARQLLDEARQRRRGERIF